MRHTGHDSHPGTRRLTRLLVCVDRAGVPYRGVPEEMGRDARRNRRPAVDPSQHAVQTGPLPGSCLRLRRLRTARDQAHRRLRLGRTQPPDRLPAKGSDIRRWAKKNKAEPSRGTVHADLKGHPPSNGRCPFLLASISPHPTTSPAAPPSRTHSLLPATAFVPSPASTWSGYRGGMAKEIRIVVDDEFPAKFCLSN